MNNLSAPRAMKRHNGKYALGLIVFACMHLSACNGRSTAQNEDRSKSDPVSYKVLYDELGARITIGVGPDVDEQQLRKTLAKAARDHQDDPARDYLVADHFWVEAYLVTGNRQSTKPAGRLGRYVPPRNPNAKGEDKSTVKEDQILITLDEARDSLR